MVSQQQIENRLKSLGHGDSGKLLPRRGRGVGKANSQISFQVGKGMSPADIGPTPMAQSAAESRSVMNFRKGTKRKRSRSTSKKGKRRRRSKSSTKGKKKRRRTKSSKKRVKRRGTKSKSKRSKTTRGKKKISKTDAFTRRGL